MRISKMTSSSHKVIFYVVSDVYNGATRSSKIVERLGTAEEIKAAHNTDDPQAWMKEHLSALKEKQKEDNKKIIVALSSGSVTKLDQQRLFNGGFVYLKKIYQQLGLPQLCDSLSSQYRFDYSLSAILEDLLYGRIIYPGSKRSTCQLASSFLEHKAIPLQQYYRALDILAAHSDEIQAGIYQQSSQVVKRDTSILYYDCTNFYCEIEQAKGDRQYGISKESRPNPLIEAGLFMDGSGIPLAIQTFPGNTNEQETAIPISKTIEKEFAVSRFIYCADAGLGSNKIKKYHNDPTHSYVVTQSLKKLKGHLKQWALDPDGWSLPGRSEKIDLSAIDDSANNTSVYYKERWINENNLEERMIVSFSPVYKAYLRAVRDGQIKRAQSMVDRQSSAVKPRQNDPKRFIKSTYTTASGEAAEEETVELKTERIKQEKQYDGFYAVVTTLDDPIEVILKINSGRWEIEETFRIMKTNMKARPIYLQKDNRIKAHFLTCFIALLLYRLLEKKLPQGYTCDQIISTLRSMNYLRLDEGYVPAYTRTDLTDSLHTAFDIPLDTEIIPTARMRKTLR